RLGPRNIAAEGGELVGPPPLVFAAAELADQPVVQQTLDDPVERARTETDGAARELLDVLENLVAVRVAVGERDQHIEHRRRQRQQVVRIAFGHGVRMWPRQLCRVTICRVTPYVKPARQKLEWSRDTFRPEPDLAFRESNSH